MSKGKSWSVQSGQLTGAHIKIETVQNNGLKESILVVNRGTMMQPMSGWVLASLIGQVFYLFPETLIIMPGMTVVIYSGQQNKELPRQGVYSRTEFTWTKDQVWNNHGDTALLFDANGIEVDRYSYPHNRVLGSSANHAKTLVCRDNSFEITDTPLVHTRKVTRKQTQ